MSIKGLMIPEKKDYSKTQNPAYQGKELSMNLCEHAEGKYYKFNLDTESQKTLYQCKKTLLKMTNTNVVNTDIVRRALRAYQDYLRSGVDSQQEFKAVLQASAGK